LASSGGSGAHATSEGRARRGPIVTLDGPAGSGKSTTAKAVARALDFRYLDSGALYRALTLGLLRSGIHEDRWAELSEDDLRALDVSVDSGAADFRVLLGGRPVDDELRAPEVTERVSELARLPTARACLLDIQRKAGAAGRLIADGRDMGSVVFPDADVKVYLVADLEERARRRLREEGLTDPTAADLMAQSEAIAQRDRRDSERAISPLRKPAGAHEIDTTELDFDAQVAEIVALVRALTPK
jgi:cytidylate kinase